VNVQTSPASSALQISPHRMANWHGPQITLFPHSPQALWFEHYCTSSSAAASEQTCHNPCKSKSARTAQCADSFWLNLQDSRADHAILLCWVFLRNSATMRVPVLQQPLLSETAGVQAAYGGIMQSSLLCKTTRRLGCGSPGHKSPQPNPATADVHPAGAQHP